MRFIWRQKEMNCINGESVLLQVQVRFQWKSNRTSPVQLISTVKTERGRETQRVQLVQLHPQSVSFKTSAPWIRHLIYRVAPSSARTSIPLPLHLSSSGWTPLPHPSHPSPLSPPLSLLIHPQRGRFCKGLWLPWWFSIKTTMTQRALWFLNREKKTTHQNK